MSIGERLVRGWSAKVPSPQWLGRSRAATALIVSTVLLAFWPTWKSLVSIWLSYASHGFLIAGIVVWLLARNRATLVSGDGGGKLALLAVGVSSVAWAAAVAIGLQLAHQLLLLILAWSWIAAVGGNKALKVAVPICATFLWALPIWNLLIPPLQWATVAANRALLWVFGLQAVVRENTITIPYGTFEVAQSCSGIIYLMVGLAVGLAYAWLFVRHPMGRVRVILLAVGLSMLGNWLRVFGLILVGFATEMQSPLMVSHGWYGWIVFGLTMVPFFHLSRLLEDGKQPTIDPQEPEQPVPNRAHLARLAPATVVALLGPAWFAALSIQPPAAVRDYQLVHPENAGWHPVQPERHGPQHFVPAYLGFDSSIVTRWRHAEGETDVQLTRLVYGSQSQGKEMIGDGNALAEGSLVLGSRLRWIRAGGLEQVRETVVSRSADTPLLVWSWFNVAGINTASPTTAKLLEVVALVRSRRASEALFLSSSCDIADCTEAARILSSVVRGDRSRRDP